jgi:hypothetical protein
MAKLKELEYVIFHNIEDPRIKIYLQQVPSMQFYEILMNNKTRAKKIYEG